MTTHATIYHIDASTMAVEFAFDKERKEAIAAMIGSDWDKATKRWLVPVARLGDVVKLFWPNVTLDYDVLRARDEQLKRMFRQYRQLGVAFWVEGGKVRSDNAVLDAWFGQHGTSLHVQALTVVLAEPVKQRLAPSVFQPVPVEDLAIETWLRGVKNAKSADEKKAAMLASKKRRKQAA